MIIQQKWEHSSQNKLTSSQENQAFGPSMERKITAQSLGRTKEKGKIPTLDEQTRESGDGNNEINSFQKERRLGATPSSV